MRRKKKLPGRPYTISAIVTKEEHRKVMRAVTKQGESMSHWLCRMAICRADQVNEVEPADLQETNVDDERVLADTWQKFDRGDPITDGELKELINSAKEGLRYLRARGERFVSYKTILDIETLRGFQSTRKAT